MDSVDRRQDFAKPIRRKTDVRNVRHPRHSLATPACDIGHDDIVAEVQLGLDQEPPTARTVLAVLEWTAQSPEKSARRVRMRECRTR